jgi:nucleoside 2-deoxyribosyltransferase
VKKLKAYVASPYGFSESGRLFYHKEFLPCIQSAGFGILDPWKPASALEERLNRALRMGMGDEKRRALSDINYELGCANRQLIDSCDMLVGGLDGTDIDSGTASEIGYAAGIGKTIEGYRNDFRLAGDNIGSIVNLQVECFIRMRFGRISTTLEDLRAALRRRASLLA